jgi:hypothetical protein
MKLNKLLGVCALPISVVGPIGVLLTLPGVKVSEIRLNERLLVASIALSFMFLLSYLATLNEGVIRAVYLIIINIILFSVVSSKSWRNNLNYVAEVVYKFNIAILLISFFFDPVAILFGRAGVGAERLGGLVGYDFVAFFVSIYIISRIETGRLLFRWPLFLHLSLATFVTLNSGRFGFIILLLLYLYVLARFATIRAVSIMLAVGVVGYLFNSERVSLIFNTLFGVYEYLALGSGDAFDSISADATGGFYAASPLTWLGEFGMAFKHLPEYLLPSNVHLAVDSGPAYMILNSGLCLTILFYWLFFWVLKMAHATNIFIILIIIATDLKFRSAFSVFLMLWIYINCICSNDS